MYILDECANMKRTLASNLGYLRSSDVYGMGVDDDILLSSCISAGQTLVTGDKLLALKCVMQNQKVVFQTRDGRKTLLEARALEFVDPISEILQASGSIIAP